MPPLTTTFIAGAGLLTLLYLVWITMSGLGLKGVTLGQPMSQIRQEAGLSLILITLLSVGLIFFYFFVTKAPAMAPVPA